MWIIILILALAAAGGGAAYLTLRIAHFGGIRAISGERKWLCNLLSLLTVSTVFFVLSCAMSLVNAVIVLLHTTVFFLIFGGFFRLIKHPHKDKGAFWQGWLALIASSVYLYIGRNTLYNVCRTDYTVKSDKKIDLKIAMFADSHLGTSFDGIGFSEHLKRIGEQKPDILLITGDFVDDGTKKDDLQKACRELGKMELKYGVWYCYGNHDKGYFKTRDFSANELEKTLKDNGVHVLADEYELVDDKFYVAGRLDSSYEKRKNMDDLLDGIDTDKYIIVMDHQPNDYRSEADSPADLVLSGHTHGGQLFPLNRVGDLLGINDRTYGYENRNGTDFIVTSGISDWEMQFKTGTKSEYVIVNVE